MKPRSNSCKCRLELILARGEDIPQRIIDLSDSGTLAFGLTGDDLFDEYVARYTAANDIAPGLKLLNTYDWFDKEAEFRRPALCLMNKMDGLRIFQMMPKLQ
jgi:hypothetical protein